MSNYYTRKDYVNRAVQTVADLPTSGISDGEVYTIIDTESQYMYTDNAGGPGVPGWELLDATGAVGNVIPYVPPLGAPSENPLASNDSADTAGIGKQFAVGSFWTNPTTHQMYICKDASVGTAIWRKIGNSGNTNLVTVSKNQDVTDFVSIADAADFIASLAGPLAPSATNPYLIYIQPGEYLETRTIELAPYVSISGDTINTILIKASAPFVGPSLVKMSNLTELSFVSLDGNGVFPVGSGKIGVECEDVGDFAQLHKVSIYNCDIGIDCDAETVASKVYLEYVDINGEYSIGLEVDTKINMAIPANYGIATAGTATSITDGLQAWGINSLVGNYVMLRGGISFGQDRLILSNDATTIDIEGQFTQIPVNDGYCGYYIGYPMFVNAENVYFFPDSSNTGRDVLVENGGSIFSWSVGEINGVNGSVGLEVREGGEARLQSIKISQCDIGIYYPLFGSVGNHNAPVMDVLNVWIDFCVTNAVKVESLLVGGQISGDVEPHDVDIVAGNSNISQLIQSETPPGVNIVGAQYLGYTSDKLTDISTLTQEGFAMGAMTEPEVTLSGGLDVTIASGFGYVMAGTGTDIAGNQNRYLKRVDWIGQTVTCSADVLNYLSIDEDGVASAELSQRSFITDIPLGTVWCDSTDALFWLKGGRSSHHTSSYIDESFRKAIGPIYSSGSLVTENTGTADKLDATSGRYYFSLWENNPLGGSAIWWYAFSRVYTPTLVLYWHDGGGAPGDYFNRTTAPFNVLTTSADTNNEEVFIGADSTFNTIRLTLDSVLTNTGAVTMHYEYWNGAGWQALAGVSDGTSEFSLTGPKTITFTLPGDWATTTVGGNLPSKYWVKLYISGADPDVNTSLTGIPTSLNSNRWSQTIDSSITEYWDNAGTLTALVGAIPGPQEWAKHTLYISGDAGDNIQTGLVIDDTGALALDATHIPVSGESFPASYINKDVVITIIAPSTLIQVRRIVSIDITGQVLELNEALNTVPSNGDSFKVTENNETYSLVYGQTTFASLVDAQNGALPTPPGSWVGRNIISIASVIVEGGVGVVEIRDERPRVAFQASAVSGVTDHGSLSGLGNDDHTIYLLASGTRALTGSLDMGTNAITNVGNVDGVDVSAHASRHLPLGADALTVGIPSDIGVVNAAGGANAFARQDHVHAHGNQTVDTLHALVVAATSHGFMDKADKTKLDGIASGAQNNTASNQGVGGVGLYHSKVLSDLQFKNINVGSNKLSVTDDAVNKEVDLDVVPGNITHADLGTLNSVNYTHLTQANHTDLTDGGDSALHYHSSDRDETNFAYLDKNKEISIPVQQMSTTSTNAANLAVVNSIHTVRTYGGVTTAVRQAYGKFFVPEDFKTGSALTAYVIWSHSDANDGNNLVMNLEYHPPIAATESTAQATTTISTAATAHGATNTLFKTSLGTIAGSANGDMISFRLYRDPTVGGDTLSNGVAVDVHELRIEYTSNKRGS